jgi:pantothenate kinase-related protein Tda10
MAWTALEVALFGHEPPARRLLEERESVFRASSPAFDRLAEKLGYTALDHCALRNVYIPLAQHIVKSYGNGRTCFVVGITGGPAAGKTTLAEILDLIFLNGFHLNTIRFSSDDLYLPPTMRRALGHKWRGADTLDLAAARNIFECLQKGAAFVDVPRYDLAADDRRQSERLHGPWSICLFEGWLVGKIVTDAFGASRNVINYLIFLDAAREYLKSARFKRKENIRLRSQGREGLCEEDMSQFWQERIVPSMVAFTLPYRREADLIIRVDDWQLPLAMRRPRKDRPVPSLTPRG